jgi:hypothetical protein
MVGLALGFVSIPQKFRITIVSAIIVLSFVCLLVGLSHRSSQPQPYFRPAPPELTLHALGSATNYLRFNHKHDWKAFCVSNGMSKTIFYMVTEVEYRTPEGWCSAGNWLSNTLTNGSLMTQRNTSGDIGPWTNDVFYVSVRSTNLPWRIRVGCFKSTTWQDSSFSKAIDLASGRIQRPGTKSWSGYRYELIGEEISP